MSGASSDFIRIVQAVMTAADELNSRMGAEFV